MQSLYGFLICRQDLWQLNSKTARENEFSGFYLINRQRYRKGCTLIHLTSDRNTSGAKVNYSLYKGKSETVAFCSMRLVTLIEFVKNERQLFLLDSSSRIGNTYTGYFYRAVFWCKLYRIIASWPSPAQKDLYPFFSRRCS